MLLENFKNITLHIYFLSRINHSKSAIMKPLPATTDTGQREINEAMKRVQEAESFITAVIEPGIYNVT